MWRFTSEALPAKSGVRVTILDGVIPVSVGTVLESLRTDPLFRGCLNDLMAKTTYSAFRWETPGITQSDIEKPFEFVLLDSPDLAPTANREPFAEHFQGDEGDVVSFSNLGKNAILIAPCPKSSDFAYAHLASFVRHAPESQRHSFWEKVGATMIRRLNDRRVWLSTAGAGVAWLHVRLDDQPKYYRHRPYRNIS